MSFPGWYQEAGEWFLSAFKLVFLCVNESGERMGENYKGICYVLFLSPLITKISLDYEWSGTQNLSLNSSYSVLPFSSCHFPQVPLLNSQSEHSLLNLVLVFFTFYSTHDLFWYYWENVSNYIEVCSLLWFWASNL